MDSIHSIYDMPDVYDQYSVVLHPVKGRENNDYWPCLSLSHNPDHPCGVSLWCELVTPPGDYLGRLVTFDDLPEEIQQHIINRIQQGDNKS
jgi:hypothetical protein